MIDTSSSMMYHISNLNDESYKITYQMATGKNMENGSEDALLHKDLIDLDDKLQVTQGLLSQLDKTQAFNETSDANMSEVKDALDSIKVDLLKGLNAGIDRSDKTALSTNLQGIREGMIDSLNTKINGEYLFSGSLPLNETMVKDSSFDLNGKVSFEGDGFLREIAVQPGSYRDRGVTAYDVAFYNSDSANAGETLTFEEGERIIDNNGNEWKFNESKNRLQKYDYDGIKIEPLEEIKVKTAPSNTMSIGLNMGSATDAKGDFVVKIEGAAGSPYSYTATGDSTAVAPGYGSSIDEIIDAPDGLLAQIQVDYPSATREGDAIVINTVDAPFQVEVFDTDTQYAMVAENQVEASYTQSKQNSYEVVIPTEYEGMVFESKHNYFDDLNKVINALDGYTTNLDGTRGLETEDAIVDDILREVLEQTISQFDSTNAGHGELGGRNAIFENSYDKLLTQETHYNLLIVEWGSADTAQLALESQALDLTYQSLFSTISKMSDMSLVNFIK